MDLKPRAANIRSMSFTAVTLGDVICLDEQDICVILASEEKP